MPDSLFDKLGDLLSDALESGDIPQYEQAEAPSDDDSASAFFAGAESAAAESAWRAAAGGTERAGYTAHDAAGADGAQHAGHTTHTATDAGSTRARATVGGAGWRFTGSAKKPRPFPARRRFLSEHERAAFRTLGIAEDTSYSDAKRLYHEKLQRFHPDKQGDSAVLQKVAREKTAALIEAWAVVERVFAADTRS